MVTQQNNRQPYIPAQIATTRTQDKHETQRIDFPDELSAQRAFDNYTRKGSEFEGYLQWDLIVKHPEHGSLCRRTMFTQE